MDFWSGFEKQARLDKDNTKRDVALAAGGAYAGTSAVMGIHDLRRYSDKNRVYAKSIKGLKKQLRPGDVILTSSSFHDGPHARDLKTLLRVGKGGEHYHGTVYIGKGRVMEATGMGTRASSTRIEDIPSKNISVYRPKHAVREDIKKAVNFAKKSRGTPYANSKELWRNGVSYLTGIGGGRTGKAVLGPKGSIVCTEMVAEAYPKIFKKKNIGTRDIETSKDMINVVNFKRGGKGIRGMDKVLSSAAHPLLKNIKWGLVGGALAYAAHKASKNKKPTQ